MKHHGQGHQIVHKLKTEIGYHLIYNKLQQGVKNINFCSSDIPVFHLELGTDSFQQNQRVQLLRLVSDYL